MKRLKTTAVCGLLAVMTLSSCSPMTAKTVGMVNDTSTFEIALLTHVSKIDFSAYQQVPGFGVTGYYDKKYEKQDGGDVAECYVLYSVTSYPDASSFQQYVTRIDVTDPSVDVCGYSVGDNAQDFHSYLLKQNFRLLENSERVRRFEKGKVRVHFCVEPQAQTIFDICVEVEVRNLFGLIF